MEKKTIKSGLLPVLALSLLIFSLLTCSNPFYGGVGSEPAGDMGFFTLQVWSSGTISRSAVSYPPSSQADYDQLKFVVKFVNGGSVVREFSQEKNSEISGTVPVGSYTVTVDVSVIADNSLFASGSSSNVQINPGPNPTIRVDVYGAIHVSVSPPEANVHATGTQQFSATLTPASANQSVNWTVTGGRAGTGISTSGLLTVDADETLGTVLTVRASSVADPSKYAEAKVTVSTPTAPTPSISSGGHPQGATYKNGDPVAPLTVSHVPLSEGAPSFQWYSNTSNSNSGGTAITGETGTSYTPPITTVGTIYYYVVITNTLAGHASASTPSNPAAIRVIRPVANINNVPTTATAETPLSLSANVLPNDATNRVISWDIVVAGTTSGGAFINGDVLHTFVAGDVIVSATIINGTTDGAGALASFNMNFTITINAAAGINAQTPSISLHPESGTVTVGATVALSVTAISPEGESLGYQWHSNNLDNNTSGTLISGATGSGYSFTASTIGPTYYYVVVTNTISDNGDGGSKSASATSAVAAITVTGNLNTWTVSTIAEFGGDEIHDIAFGNGTFVLVGDGAQMAYSANATSWTYLNETATFGIWSNDIRAIAFENNIFVAAGEDGKRAYSNNATSWTPATADTNITGIIFALGYGSNRFVAGAMLGQMAYSTDGVSWTAVSNSGFGSFAIYDIAFGNGTFIAVGNQGQMSLSTTGITWTAATNPIFSTTIDIQSITYGDNKFVAVGNNGLMSYSINNGSTWTAVSSPFGTNTIFAITYGGGMFVAGGSGGEIAYSSDGITWTGPINIGFAGSDINAIVYGDGRFVAVGDDGKIAVCEW